jgi:hypothetical protein
MVGIDQGHVGGIPKIPRLGGLHMEHEHFGVGEVSKYLNRRVDWLGLLYIGG